MAQTTTTRFALVETYNECTLQYKTAKYGNGNVCLVLFDTLEEAQRELQNWLLFNSNVTFMDLQIQKELYEQDNEGYPSLKDFTNYYMPQGEGWYKDNGSFLGTDQDVCINLGDYHYQIQLVAVTKTVEVDNDNEEVTYTIKGAGINFTCEADRYTRLGWF